MKASNLNLSWDPARSSFTPSHSHTGMQAHTHTWALAVSGTFSHCESDTATRNILIPCFSCALLPSRCLWNETILNFYLKEKLTLSQTGDFMQFWPISCHCGYHCFLMEKTKFTFPVEWRTWLMRTEALCSNPTFIAANEGWKALIEPGSGGSSCFLPEEGAVSGEAGPVQQPNCLNRSKKSSSFLHPHLLRLPSLQAIKSVTFAFTFLFIPLTIIKHFGRSLLSHIAFPPSSAFILSLLPTSSFIA